MMSGAIRIAFLSILLAITSDAAEPIPIAKSIKALAGLYSGSDGMAQFRRESISIAPDGKVSFKMPLNVGERGFLDGKITNFSSTGFAVKFTGMKQAVDMKFEFHSDHPKSIFRDDGADGVWVFTR